MLLILRRRTEKETYRDLALRLVGQVHHILGRHRADDQRAGWISGLLFDAGRIVQSMDRSETDRADLLCSVLDAALAGLAAFARGGSLRYPVEYRLAFRELGLAIGLTGVTGRIRDDPEIFGRGALERRAETLMGYAPLADAIVEFWADERNQEAGTWAGNPEINMVMLATALAPGEFLAVSLRDNHTLLCRGGEAGSRRMPIR